MGGCHLEQADHNLCSSSPLQLRHNLQPLSAPADLYSLLQQHFPGGFFLNGQSPQSEVSGPRVRLLTTGNLKSKLRGCNVKNQCVRNCQWTSSKSTDAFLGTYSLFFSISNTPWFVKQDLTSSTLTVETREVQFGDVTQGNGLLHQWQPAVHGFHGNQQLVRQQHDLEDVTTRGRQQFAWEDHVATLAH